MKKSKRILAGGISGNFMSPHYDDQFDLWLAGKFRPFVLSREEILKDKKYQLILTP
ncbi:penicillin acylase family protein [bacterium]|nr:penicillin acylase family protein [bacterium]